MDDSYAPLRKEIIDEIIRFIDASADLVELKISLRERRRGLTTTIAKVALELARKTKVIECGNFDNIEHREVPLEVLILCNDLRKVADMQKLLRVLNIEKYVQEMTEHYKSNITVKPTSAILPHFVAPFDASLRGKLSSADIVLVDDAQFVSAALLYCLPAFCKKIILCQTGIKTQEDLLSFRLLHASSGSMEEVD